MSRIGEARIAKVDPEDLNEEARFLDLDEAGRVQAADDFSGGETVEDVAGDGTVKTVTFSAAVTMVLVEQHGGSDTDVTRVDVFGGTPTATKGSRVPEDEPRYLPTPATTSIKALVPTGATLTVTGWTRA